MFDEGTVLRAFRTAEVAIDPPALAALVRTALAAQTNIRTILHTTVTAVAPKDRAAEVEYQDAAGHHVELYDQVINALWESRLAIDATAGLKPQRPWLHRVKFFVRLQAPAHVDALPSVTTVLGPFGDIVNYGNGEFYLSWYPAGMLGMSTDIQPPDWLAAAQALAPQLKSDIATALTAIVPPVARISDADLARAELRGGYIFAWGESDIDDRNSGLHERYAVGPHSVGHYHSVDTGKLTMAPLFAQQVADRICPSQG
jgi:hypothetical protein